MLAERLCVKCRRPGTAESNRPGSLFGQALQPGLTGTQLILQ